jgi:AcrR family transcriptional regulator
VLERRAAAINQERMRLLEAYEAECKEGPARVEGILYAFVGPTIQLMENHPEFLRFAARLFSDPDPKMRDVLAAQFGEVARRFHAALCRALPHLSPGEVSLRLGYIVGAVLFAWTNQTDMTGIFGVPPAASDPQELMQHLVHYGAAGMRAESHTRGYVE